jgi:hypothetical protein
MLFNNIVSSYLKVEKNGQIVGKNIRSLQREAKSSDLLEPLNTAGGSSQLGVGEAPLVDQSFIDSLLGQIDEDLQ